LRQVKNIQDVVDWGLCTGCGACHSACEKGGVRLINIEKVGIRPRFDSDLCAKCTACLAVCPGYEVDARLAVGNATHEAGNCEYGGAIEIWEGYAADPEIRHSASSGGVLSALAVFCLEREGADFVLHTAMKEDEPWANETVRSRSRDEILSRTGSRYAPASPCEGLRLIEEAPGKAVFIGKPCDTAAVFKMRGLRPELDRKLGLVLTFFCAGTPSSRGTLDLLNTLNVDAAKVTSVRFRGNGWPGRFRVMEDSGKERSASYSESWGALTRYRPQRCHLCPDGLGRVADIACGDAWDRFEENGDAGRSLIIVRTSHGRDMLRRAMEAGYVVANRTGSFQVIRAQSNLLARRREIFGRLAAMKMLGVPTPRLLGFSLFRSWLRLPLKTKVKTVAGTVLRLIQRGRYRRQPAFGTELR